jgi:hypothetical protein
MQADPSGSSFLFLADSSAAVLYVAHVVLTPSSAKLDRLTTFQLKHPVLSYLALAADATSAHQGSGGPSEGTEVQLYAVQVGSSHLLQLWSSRYQSMKSRHPWLFMRFQSYSLALASPLLLSPFPMLQTAAIQIYHVRPSDCIPTTPAASSSASSTPLSTPLVPPPSPAANGPAKAPTSATTTQQAEAPRLPSPAQASVSASAPAPAPARPGILQMLLSSANRSSSNVSAVSLTLLEVSDPFFAVLPHV